MKRTPRVIWSWASPTLMVLTLMVLKTLLTTPLTLGTPPIIVGDGKEVLSDGGTTITWTIPTRATDDDNVPDGGPYNFPYHAVGY